ncbi:MAG: M23 family metallopeptidase [Bacteroidales bacterium]|nr:M23 family metallopeptidase [Bacteroidales bacterium]
MKQKLLLFFIILLSLNSFAQKPKYIMPMDIPPLLSASFAEMRANHFHAGLDFTTSGEMGVPIKAVADGYVSRIKVGPFGYGTALYITHYDGYTTLYGHLSGYAPKIEKVIEAEQYKLKSFEVEYYPKENEIPVKKGEIVAFSGNSGGSGGPHLHFEVRETESEDALNPLDFLPEISDTQAPTVYGIKIYALEDDSQVAGLCSDKYFTMAQINNRTINAYGHIGFGINAVDYFIAGHRPCGVVEIALYDNDNLIFKSRLDRVPFDKSRYINSHIDFEEYQDSRNFIQKSFVDVNNNLLIYDKSEDTFVEEGETHKMRYELKDFIGNKKVVNFNVVGKKSETATPKTHIVGNVEWIQTCMIDTLNFVAEFPYPSFYKNEYLEIDTSYSKVFSQTIYHLGNYRISIHNYSKIYLPLPECITSMIGTKINQNQIYAGLIGDKNSIYYLGGKVNDKHIEVETRILGRFVVSVDTIAPNVKIKNKGSEIFYGNQIAIHLTDNKSGINKYNVYIDNQWKIFEYDYKNKQLIANVSKLNIKPGSHILKATVTDKCENEKTIEWKFRVK